MAGASRRSQARCLSSLGAPLPAAAAAARQALVRDLGLGLERIKLGESDSPLKTALLSGMLGSSTALERLLDNEDFARFWEALPGR